MLRPRDCHVVRREGGRPECKFCWIYIRKLLLEIISLQLNRMDQEIGSGKRATHLGCVASHGQVNKPSFNRKSSCDISLCTSPIPSGSSFSLILDMRAIESASL